MNKLEKKRKKLKKIKNYHKAASETYGSELCAGDMIAKEENLEKKIAILEKEKKEENILWKKYAKSYGIKSIKAYKLLSKNHTHPLGDEGEDMVTFEIALKAIKIAEKELKKKYENRKNKY